MLALTGVNVLLSIKIWFEFITGVLKSFSRIFPFQICKPIAKVLSLTNNLVVFPLIELKAGKSITICLDLPLLSFISYIFALSAF